MEWPSFESFNANFIITNGVFRSIELPEYGDETNWKIKFLNSCVSNSLTLSSSHTTHLGHLPQLKTVSCKTEVSRPIPLPAIGGTSK